MSAHEIEGNLVDSCAEAKVQFQFIDEMVAALSKADKAGENDEAVADRAYEATLQTIRESPLSVAVRSGWHAVGSAGDETMRAEYRILLCGAWPRPAVQIIGDLTEFSEPENARLQCQDFGMRDWHDVHWPDLPENAEEVLLAYARCFYFGGARE